MSTVHSKGRLHGDKIKYKDGIGCCVWYLMPGGTDPDEDSGVCFDFSFEDIDDFISLLQELKEAKPDVYNYEKDEVEPVQ